MPAETAETIERRLMAFRTGVTLHEIQTLDRHVQFRVLGVVKQHELTARCARGWLKPARKQGRSRSQIEHDQSAKPRDPVIDVHDIIVDFQIAKVRKKGRGPRAPLLLAPDGGGASLKCRLGRFIEKIAFDVDYQTRGG